MKGWFVVGADGDVAGPHDLVWLQEQVESGALTMDVLVAETRDGLASRRLEEVFPRTGFGRGREPTNWASIRFRGSPSVPGMPVLAVEDDGWQQIAPAPWRRYFARLFDAVLIGICGGAVVGAVTAAYRPALYDAIFDKSTPWLGGMATTLLFYVLIVSGSGLLIGRTGTTPGKWLFGTRITRRDGRPIGVLAALRREISVLVLGQGLGLPLLTLLASWFAYSELRAVGATSWDAAGNWVVTHRKLGAAQWMLTVMGVVIPVVVSILLATFVGSRP